MFFFPPLVLELLARPLYGITPPRTLVTIDEPPSAHYASHRVPFFLLCPTRRLARALRDGGVQLPVCVFWGATNGHHAYAFAFARNGLGNIRPLWRAATDPDHNPARRHGSVCVPYSTGTGTWCGASVVPRAAPRRYN